MELNLKSSFFFRNIYNNTEITWDSNTLSLIYNGTEQFPTYELANLVDGDNVGEIISGKHTNVVANRVASITSLTDLNYKLPTETSTTFDITPITVGLTWTNLDLTYSGKPQIINANISGVLDIDSEIIGVTQTKEQVDAGNYTAEALLTGNTYGNYVLPSEYTKEFTIKQKLVTVTANLNTIIYGSAPTHNNSTYFGFVEGEDESVLTTNVTYTYSYQQSRSV